ncbi:MAG: hypothetical protein HY209_03625 [Candidatus Omnitrophica bacterium]|nr:hypothetical protein [Candidatus Omnitrophota bacterium]
MFHKYLTIVSFFVFFILSAAVSATQVGQLIRSEEMDQKQKQILDWAQTSRAYFFNDYSISGIELTLEQSKALQKIVEPKDGRFLKKGEVDDLCLEITGYIHKQVKPSLEISCAIESAVLRVWAHQ